MQDKYKKIVCLCTKVIVISIAIIFIISNLNKEEFAQVSQSNNTVLHMIIEEIYTEEDYIAFAESVNGGNYYQNCEVSLQADLDFSEYDNLIPIGTVGEEGQSFCGIFNGNGHTISGVTIERPGDYAGLFINLGGIVKNLQVKDSIFSGHVCGVIATDTIEAAVLNCYVDVQVSGKYTGTIVGILDGKLRNCVSTSYIFVGELKEGQIEHCYQSHQAKFDELNRNLVHVSGYYDDTDFCLWENGHLSANKADLLETLIARLNVRGEEIKLFSYYSKSRQSWCFTLPASHGNEMLFFEAETSNGGHQNFSINPEEETMIFTWENRYYPIDFLCADNIESVFVTLQKQKDLSYVHNNKTEEIPGVLTVIDRDGNTFSTEVKGFYGHGNDSWASEKKSYNLKLETYTDLLGMGNNDDYVFIAGYRNDSLMSYVATNELSKELGFAYAPEFRLVNLYVAGEYIGVYFLAEKLEIDQNRIDIESVYENAKKECTARLDSFEYNFWNDEQGRAQRYFYNVNENPKDITGGYLLEADNMDYAEDDSRFVSNHQLSLTLKRSKYSSKEQVDYIADYWQAFEDGLFSEDGYNAAGHHYSEYIDIESFAMQWLYFELAQEISVSSSIYFYKESDITGDGLMHACFPWDVEHSYVEKRLSEELWMVERTGFKRYWQQIYKHEDFQRELRKVWNEKYVPAIQKMISEEPMEYESGLKNLKWYQENIVGIHFLENSRWETMYPWNRCDEISEFMKVRMNALTKCLNVQDVTIEVE